VDINQYSRIILEFLAERQAQVGDGAAVDEVVEYGIDRGLSLDVMENAMIQASSHGWIFVTEQHVSLSEKGFAMLNHANDNEEGGS
jgi:hypothetical protein